MSVPSSDMRARVERFGAWVRVDERTLIAVDRDAARSLGLDGGAEWALPASIADGTNRPLEVHVAITTRCPATCAGCYQDAGPDGSHRAFSDICATLDAIARDGAFTVAFGGGEPLVHPDLARIAEHARSVGLVPVVTTSGIGLTSERARALRAFAQVNVSHDGVDGGYDAVRGFDGARGAERAIEHLVAASIPVGINVVLTRASFGAGGARLLATARHARTLGAHEVQLLRWKPAGRATLDYFTRRLDREDVAALPAVLRALTDVLSVRIDCAMLPLLSPWLTADPRRRMVENLLALGVFGCEAGRALTAVDVEGVTAPCSFAKGSDPAEFAAYPARAPEPCASCPIQRVCRGGCRIVAAHVAGDAFVPDPECPRVISAVSHAQR